MYGAKNIYSFPDVERTPYPVIKFCIIIININCVMIMIVIMRVRE